MKDFFRFVSNLFVNELGRKVKIYLLVFTWVPILFVIDKIFEIRIGKPLAHTDMVNVMVVSFLVWVGIIIIREIIYFRKK
jgi:hypothetical protein